MCDVHHKYRTLCSAGERSEKNHRALQAAPAAFFVS